MCNKGTDWSIDKAGGAFRYDGDGKLLIKPLPTKHGMVQKILKALYNSTRAFSSDHGHYKKLMRLGKRDLVRDFILAENIIADRMAKRLSHYLAVQAELKQEKGRV